MAGDMSQLAKTKIGQAIFDGNIQMLKELLLREKDDPLFKDRKDNTYLHYIATLYRPYIIHILLTTAIDINVQNRHGNTALHVTALQDECCHVADLMAAGIDPTIKNKDGKTAAELKTNNLFWQSIYDKYKPGIFQAISEHNVERFLELLHCWSKLTAVRNGQTLRQFAAALKFHDIVFLIDDHKPTLDAVFGVLEINKQKVKEALKRSKCNVNYLNHASTKQHILQYAIQLQDFELVNIICDAGANINLPVLVNSYYWGPMYFEAINNKLPGEIVWKILKSKRDFSLKDERGRTCLTFALDKTNGTMPLDVLTYMLKQGASFAERDETGSTFRDVARFARRRDVVDLIDKFYVRIVRNSDLKTLQQLATDGYDSLMIEHNYRDSYIYASGNETDDVLRFFSQLPEYQKSVALLHASIKEGDLKTVKGLLTNTDNAVDILVNARDKGGRSPLHLAVLFESYEIAQFLLSIPSVDITAKDCHMRTPYHYACAIPNAEQIRRRLIKMGADTDILDCLWRKGEQYMSNNVAEWVEKSRKKRFGMELELACIDKYEELRHIVKNRRKGLEEFSDAIKCFKKYPVMKFPKLLCPLMPSYKDLVFVALDYGKPDIAERLADLGADLAQTEKYIVDFEAETETEDDASETCSDANPPVTAELVMTPVDRARFLGYQELADHMEKRRWHETGETFRQTPTVVEQLAGQFPSVFITEDW